MFALSLGVLLGVPDGIFSTYVHYAFPAAIAVVTVTATLSVAYLQRRAMQPGASRARQDPGGRAKRTGHVPSGSRRGRQHAASPVRPPCTVPRRGALDPLFPQAAGLRWSRRTCSGVSGRCQNSQARRLCPSSRAGGGGGMARTGHRAWARQ
jgi:hypothetical protein